VSNGPEVVIDGKLVQTFALVLHELATNAAKHGALSNGIGTVAASWSVDPGDNGSFKFKWQEKDGPEVAAPTRKAMAARSWMGAPLAYQRKREVRADGVCVRA